MAAGRAQPDYLVGIGQELAALAEQARDLHRSLVGCEAAYYMATERALDEVHPDDVRDLAKTVGTMSMRLHDAVRHMNSAQIHLAAVADHTRRIVVLDAPMDDGEAR